MALLDKVISGAIEDSLPTSALLRHMLMLGSRLKSEELTSWAFDELNGYDDKAPTEFPGYRGPLPVTVLAFGIPDPEDKVETGRKQWRIDDRDLPAEHRASMAGAYLQHPLAELEKMSTRDEGVKIAWTNLEVRRYNRLCRKGEAYGPDGYVADAVIRSVPASTIHGVVDIIRTRALLFALELQQEFPNAGEINGPTTETEKVRESVTNNFNMHIYGGTNTVANGENFTQNVQIKQGDTEALLDFFKNQGLDQNGQSELQAAIKEDGEAPGNGVTRFLEKLGSGALKLGADVGAPAAVALGKVALGGFFGVPIP